MDTAEFNSVNKAKDDPFICILLHLRENNFLFHFRLLTECNLLARIFVLRIKLHLNSNYIQKTIILPISKNSDD